ncbi:MAG: (2Fe-2S)-binding protein [Turicibacter sp.]|nr:(2Fe-2S)-binding protein [Turicibacter sp.]MDO5795107.1 (2Fe-2S)-binding protein [Turicibacter sp.]
MDLNKKICYCFNVTVGDIKEEIETGSTTLQEIQSETKAGMACKGCVKRLQETIDALLAEKAE